ncbi:MAG: ATP-binding protein [Crocinitomicaceae bacterium]
MKNSAFNTEQLSKDLNERVKEIECLYRISKISFEDRDNLSQALQRIISEIPSGWQFPLNVEVNLKLNKTDYGNPIIGNIVQESSIMLNGIAVGVLSIFFNKNDLPEADRKFLKEEQALLDQIATEISRLLDYDKRKNEERELQEKLRQTDRLKLLGEITAGIAHELNTPLGNILGYSQLLQSSEFDSQRKSDLTKVITSAKHATEIVKKLMFFSCEMPSNYKQINLNDLVKESVGLLQLQLRKNNIKVVYLLDDNEPIMRVDPIQMNQVLFNIILNSVDAMKESKQGNIEIITEMTESFVLIKIKDTGTGISKKEQKSLFKPFYTTKSRSKGTGLGLAVSHGIVKAHGGEIEVESDSGKGTTFSIILKR